jgi:hypothetical protein
MKEIDLYVGTTVRQACEQLARAAPAFMVFNGARVESAVGDTPGDLQAKWRAEMDRAIEKRTRERDAYEQTNAGKAELAKAAAKSAEENRAREDALASIAANGVREKYPWGPGMGEISGFGGDYENACRDMIYAGLVWLDLHPGADLKASAYQNVFGILTAESDDAKALEKRVLAACPDCSGAMHQVTMSALMYIAKHGWSAYVERMTEREYTRPSNIATET